MIKVKSNGSESELDSSSSESDQDEDQRRVYVSTTLDRPKDADCREEKRIHDHSGDPEHMVSSKACTHCGLAKHNGRKC